MPESAFVLRKSYTKIKNCKIRAKRSSGVATPATLDKKRVPTGQCLSDLPYY